MRILKAFIILLLSCEIASATPPSRQFSYVNGDTISSDEVTSNEDVIFNYLRNGVDTYTDNTIVNADINASAAIQSDKLNLASINQAVAFSLATLSIAKGTDVASASALTLGDGNFFDVTGATEITSITAIAAGTVVTLQFDTGCTVTVGNNLHLAGSFTATQFDTLTLISDGTNYYELSRAVNQ